MKNKSRSIAILTILFGYILLQFLWWEVLLVRQNNEIANEKQKLMELSVSNEIVLQHEVSALHKKHQTQIIMIVCEGTIFLLLLLFGMYRVKKTMDKETELNLQEQNFFLSITHELKTPISATKLQLQTLLKQKLDASMQHDIIHSALHENERLNKLIDNVLLAGRIDSKEFAFNFGRHNLSLLLGEFINRYYKAEIETEQLVLNIEPDLFCKIDEQIFPSLISNLIDNAIKYSGSDRRIFVHLLKTDESIVLKMADNGFGIDASEKEKVFNRFYRAGNEETRMAKGTGLGLFIVQNIIDKHNAKISLSDNQPKGTIFEIKLNVV